MIRHSSTHETIATRAEWMDSPRTRAVGLLKYSESPKGLGAIFKLPFGGIFPLVHTFGMKFAIDILFCGSDKRVLKIYPDVQPGRFILPVKFLFGGCAFLVEFCGCPTSQIREGDFLEWEKSP